MYVDAKVEQYARALLEATHREPRITRGISSDLAKDLVAAASELARAANRSYTTPHDIKLAAVAFLRERIVLAPTALPTERDDVSASIIDNVEVP